MLLIVMLVFYLGVGFFLTYGSRKRITTKTKSLRVIMFLLEWLTWGFQVFAKMIKDVFVLIGGLSFLLLFHRTGKTLMMNTFQLMDLSTVKEMEVFRAKRNLLLEEAVNQCGRIKVSILLSFFMVLNIIGEILFLIIAIPSLLTLVPALFEKNKG